MCNFILICYPPILDVSRNLDVYFSRFYVSHTCGVYSFQFYRSCTHDINYSGVFFGGRLSLFFIIVTLPYDDTSFQYIMRLISVKLPFQYWHNVFTFIKIFTCFLMISGKLLFQYCSTAIVILH